MYGLSGASDKNKLTIITGSCSKITNFFKPVSGHHCCLWCTIRGTELKVALSTRGHSPLCSLKTLRKDHQKFLDAGGNIKKGKEFNSVIGAVFSPSLLRR